MLMPYIIGYSSSSIAQERPAGKHEYVKTYDQKQSKKVYIK
jgi:hypothetical protein